ncbi:anoctamin-7 isoform X1 [Sebastes fasciatus]|uniref:anoctamin-7 isoform X1 n=1 Tax=Sebastes fasciatus TaxID=394691 RepID=UPI003D9EC3E8
MDRPHRTMEEGGWRRGGMRRRGDQRDDSATLITMETNPETNYGSVTENAPVQPPDRNVFSDGSTRVDFVLTWEEPLSSQVVVEVQGVSPAHRKWRKKFLNRLRHSGLLQEQKEVLKRKSKIFFVLLSAPWSVLCYYAEEISLRAPLQVVPYTMTNWSEQVLSRLSLPNLMSQDVPNPPPDYYTCQFRTNKLERFLGSDNRETFFKTTQRHQVLYEILARTAYGSVKRGEVGIDRLLSEQVFTAAYPLHEGDFHLPTPPVPPQCLGLRRILYSYWAKWSSWRRYQPLDHIREYFGEKIALYFAWLGFYTGWLLPASVVGTLIFLFGFWVMATDVPAKELCNSGDSFVMCPLCDICPLWNYSSICVTFKAGIMFDNGGTVFLSVFMSLWAVTFLEYWKRTCSALSHHWDCSDFHDMEERPRPEFTTLAPMIMRNPVTGAEEPYFPQNKRVNRILTGCMVIIIMVAMVLMFLIAIILYRTIIRVIISKSGFQTSSASRIASISGSVLNLLVILILSKVYSSLAHILTRWEMHRTQTKYEDMFIFKVFVFQFANFYSSPVYIAFFKGRFIGHPGHYKTLFGIRNEDCGAGGCLVELAQELLIIMVGKQLINNAQEFIVPKVKSWWHKRKTGSHLKEVKEVKEVKEERGQEAQREVKREGEEGVSPWEADYELLVCEGLVSEYLEMVIQYGFITIFVAACPLAPLFALINNWVEVRLDAQKYVTEYRRPVAEQAKDIGIWFPILQFITQMAVLSNAFIIAFSSSFLPRLYYRYTRDSTLSGFINFTLASASRNYSQQHTPCRYRSLRDEDGEHLPEYYHLLAIRLTFVIVFEHVVFFVGSLIDMLVPDIPDDVAMKIRREHYMAKEALAENQVLAKSLIPGEKDVLSTNLRPRGPRPPQPPQSDSSPPDLKQIPEETSTPDSC